jgi:hypothetical protein
MHGEKKGSYGVLVGKPGRNRTLGRPRHTWENSIEADLYEIGWRAESDLAQHRDN